jgi:hypothetical protein
MQSPMRLFKRKPNEHNVEVHDVRPEVPGEYEPYFVAICSCGWVGDIRDSADKAFGDDRRHAPTVSEDVKRPVG